VALSDMSDPSRPLFDRLRDRFFGIRDQLVANARFQRWAASFPLTKPVADARARALFDIVAGFVYAQVLSACVKLDLFKILEAGPLPLARLAVRLNLPPDGARLLLDAAVTLDLVAKRGADCYGLGSLGAAFLGNPGLADMVAHHDLFYADMADPLALLSGDRPLGQLQRFWGYARAANPADLQASDVDGYSRLMAASQPFVADDILDAFPLHDARRLMDVGGGDGAFLVSVAKRWTQLDLMLVDLPAVAARADTRFRADGLGARATAHGRNFFKDPLPPGADVISLVRVVHDHDDAAVATLLRAAFAALPPGGRLLIAEPMAEAPGATRVGAAYFNFYLRAMGSGRSRSASELQTFLQAVGFVEIQSVPTRRPMLTGIVTARKPSSVKNK
jgi:demethylspheroidene O-methyltransferase